ncbi:MAG: hypothetical protein KatS3mg119_0422 [Rhodothalassiaceae bacterium]|nr:MAG: hypothetical protein KatS3mg119_0422 [Rhodothalassiaceae bacterium]
MQTQRTSDEDRAAGLTVKPVPAAPWRVVSARPLPGHRLKLRFVDGVEGTVVFRDGFFRGVFAPLKDEGRFRRVRVVDGVVTWPGGLDIAPDAMHDALAERGEWVIGG